MESERERILRERADLRREYGVFFERLAALLFEADPMGLNFETNSDEYESEVGTILPRLKSAASAQDVEEIIHQEFCHWFGIEDTGHPKRYQALAATIWKEWRAFAERQ